MRHSPRAHLRSSGQAELGEDCEVPTALGEDARGPLGLVAVASIPGTVALKLQRGSFDQVLTAGP